MPRQRNDQARREVLRINRAITRTTRRLEHEERYPSREPTGWVALVADEAETSNVVTPAANEQTNRVVIYTTTERRPTSPELVADFPERLVEYDRNDWTRGAIPRARKSQGRVVSRVIAHQTTPQEQQQKLESARCQYFEVRARLQRRVTLIEGLQPLPEGQEKYRRPRLQHCWSPISPCPTRKTKSSKIYIYIHIPKKIVYHSYLIHNFQQLNFSQPSSL